jgi:hypothetical protein
MFEIEKFNDAIQTVEKRALQIPFGNSKYQIDSIVAESQTPERAYRSLLLNFEKRFNDLKSGSINRRKQENKVKRLQLEADLESDDLKREAILLDIEEIITNFDYENKLADDCIEELKYMQGMIEKMPEYSRAEFEAGEKNYFELRATNKPNFQLVENIKSGDMKCLLK